VSTPAWQRKAGKNPSGGLMLRVALLILRVL
jgi:hypothetical protein